MNKNLTRNQKLTESDYTDKRRKTALVLDVETTLMNGNEQLIFDLGWTISEVSNEQMVIHRNYLIEEIFLDMNAMEKAYYFNKYPKYVKALANQKVELKPFNEIIKILNEDIKKYNVNKLYAYNANFDRTAIQKTNNYINNDSSDLNYKMICLWNLSTQTYMATQKYVLTAIENNWLSDKGNIKTSAEMAYRYLFKDYDFEESHTGLEDSVIETKILWKINTYGKKKNENDNSSPWRRIKKIKDSMGL